MVTEVPAEQVASAVEACAHEVLAEAGIVGPPVDALQLAKRLDLVVAEDFGMEVRARFVRLGAPGGAGRGTILLADDPRPERRQWAVAHEIGECMAHRLFAQLGIPHADIPQSGREHAANLLASALLLPRDWYAADGNALGWDLDELKKVYSTASHELIARRMLEMSPRVIISLFDQGALQWRRSNVVRRPPPLTPAEAKTWRIAFELAEPATCAGPELPEGIDQVRCWPVHEPGWRREILRTALLDW
ncbi:MAG: ImmA/IrrE family metallo-endopeptidase [Pirellulales bacterium]|nr:ImmA/IrrE family metallo-endopeptidase [Pirellulales bacterium]